MRNGTHSKRPSRESRNGSLPPDLREDIPRNLGKPIRRLSDWLETNYFASFMDERSARLKLLINVMESAQQFRYKMPKEKAARASAWDILRRDANDPDSLTEGFSRKSIRAAIVLMRDPSLAIDSAEKFMALHGLSKIAEGKVAAEEREYHNLLSEMLLQSAILRY